MQIPLKASGPCAGKRIITARVSWLPSLGFGLRTCILRRAHAQVDKAPEGEGTTTSSAALTSNGALHSDQHSSVNDVDAQAVVPSPKAGDPKPTAASSGSVEGDWLQPPPGDWGGTVDPQGIKEPDSSGVLFFFIIITGLSLGVHQLLRYLGASRAEEKLVRPSSGQVATVVSPASRAQLTLPASQTGASIEESPASTSATATGAVVDRWSAVEGQDVSDAATAKPQEESKAGGAVKMQVPDEQTEAETGNRFNGIAVNHTRLKDASESEMASDAEVVQPENFMPTEPGLVSVRLQQRQPTPSTAAAQSPAEASTDGHMSRSDAAKSPQPESGAVTAAEGAGLTVGVQGRSGLPGPAAPQFPKGCTVETSVLESSIAEVTPGPVAQPLLAPSSDTGGTGSNGVSKGPGGHLPVLAEHTKLGLGPGASAEGDSATRRKGAFAGASAFLMGSSTGSATVVTPQAEPSAPTRLSIPTVRPEPLSRAPDSSALTHLPNDASVGSLRERAQLALRATAAAVEASQRAAAYAAAASNAASRAAEAAERAATAATSAQAGLENAAESAIAAAEARIALAAEAAKDAEERAASAAAHATAYQDMSQFQADIAERAAAVQKPATPGPLSQLQQLWRSASSAFTHGHQQGEQHGLNDELSKNLANGGSRIAGGGGAMSRSGTSDICPSGAPGGKVGAVAAETISSTVKGLLSWLGQDDGNR